jgi:hypothetical protein
MASLAEVVDERVAAVDAWWDGFVTDLLARHNARDLWGVPSDERLEACDEYAARLREAHFRDPVHAEPTAERRRLERAALAEAAEVPTTASGRTSGEKGTLASPASPGGSVEASGEGVRGRPNNAFAASSPGELLAEVG